MHAYHFSGRKPISPIHETEEVEDEQTVPAGSRLAETRVMSANALQRNRLLPSRPTAGTKLLFIFNHFKNYFLMPFS